MKIRIEEEAHVQEPEILVLDEATSALDAETELYTELLDRIVFMRI